MSRRPLRLSPALAWGVGVFALALLIRLIGIGWGLPNDQRNQSLHPDELVIWGYSQQIHPAKLDFDPGFYNYGTLYLTALNVATSAVQAYGGGPRDETEDAMWDAIGRYHLAGRILSTLAGAALAWVGYALARRLTHRYGALYAGLALAVAPGLVVHSRFQTVDVLATLLVGLSLFYSIRMLGAGAGSDAGGETPIAPVRGAVLAGLFAGLSAGAKYSGVLALLALVVALGYLARRDGRTAARAGAAGLVACVVAFVIATPGAMTNTRKFLQDVQFEMGHTSSGHGLVFAGTPSGFLFHIINLQVGLGLLMLLVGAAGLAGACLRKKPWAFALLAFALATYVLIGRAEVKFLRYGFPLIPVLAIAGGWLVGQAHTNPNTRWRAVVAAALFGLAGFGGGGLAGSLKASLWMAGEDPRDTAGRLLKKEAGAVGLVSDPWFQTPSLYPDTGLPRSVAFSVRDQIMRAQTAPRVLRFVPPNPDERMDWDERLLDQKPDFVTFSSFEWDDVDRLMRMKDAPPDYKPFADRAEAFMKRLAKEFQLTHEIGGDGPWIHDLMYVRPRVWIWKRWTPSSTPSSDSSTTSPSSVAPAPTP